MDLQQSNMSEIKEANKLKFIYYLIILLPVLYLFSMCVVTFPKKFGPYEGIVIDMETKEPIEGAIVFLEFMLISGSVGGDVYSYGDSLDVFTDAEGKFSVPETKMPGFIRSAGNWDEHARLLVYKPGYWNFPRGASKIEPAMKPEDEIQNNSYLTIELKKTKNRSEVEKNLHSVRTSGVSIEKLINLKEMMNVDRVYLGLKPTDLSQWKQ
jgi:hypothetical protein